MKALKTITSLANELNTKTEQSTENNIKEIDIKLRRFTEALNQEHLMKWLDEHTHQYVNKDVMEIQTGTQTEHINTMTKKKYE